MKVKFKTVSAGPKGNISPGDIVDVPEKEAELLVNAGYASFLDAPLAKTAEVEETQRQNEQPKPKASSKKKASAE